MKSAEKNIRTSYFKNFATTCTFYFLVVVIEIVVASNAKKIISLQSFSIPDVSNFWSGCRPTSVKCISIHHGKNDFYSTLSANRRSIVRKSVRIPYLKTLQRVVPFLSSSWSSKSLSLQIEKRSSNRVPMQSYLFFLIVVVAVVVIVADKNE